MPRLIVARPRLKHQARALRLGAIRREERLVEIAELLTIRRGDLLRIEVVGHLVVGDADESGALLAAGRAPTVRCNADAGIDLPRESVAMLEPSGATGTRAIAGGPRRRVAPQRPSPQGRKPPRLDAATGCSDSLRSKGSRSSGSGARHCLPETGGRPGKFAGWSSARRLPRVQRLAGA